MPIEDVYADIVHLYDLEHAGFTDDIDLMLELADLGDGPILELGCGTGRVLLPLAEAGHEIIGIDSSQPMLDVAQRRIDEAIRPVSTRLIKGDMGDLGSIDDGPFGFVIASLNSIMHLTTAEQQRHMLESAYEILSDGGRLLIDTLNPSLGQLSHLLNVTHLEGSWRDADGSTVDKWGRRQLGQEAQVIDTLIWYDLLNPDGAFGRVRTRFDLRYLHQSELALMLELAGFGHIDWYGSYELDEWDAESDRIIAIAHKDAS